MGTTSAYTTVQVPLWNKCKQCIILPVYHSFPAETLHTQQEQRESFCSLWYYSTSQRQFFHYNHSTFPNRERICKTTMFAPQLIICQGYYNPLLLCSLLEFNELPLYLFLFYLYFILHVRHAQICILCLKHCYYFVHIRLGDLM